MLNTKKLLTKILGLLTATPLKTTVTPMSGSSYAPYGGCYYETWGRLVHLHLGINGLTANVGVTVATMPSALCPPSKVFAQGTAGGLNSQVIAEMETDGTTRVYPSATYCGVDLYYII